MFKKLTLILGGIILMTNANTAEALDADNTLLLELSTGGTIAIQMKPDVAPVHVERIKTLTKEGFYDGVIFHRVIDGFMAQTGDPTGTGMGGSEYPDLPAEFNDTHHGRGAVSMARTQDPDSANSQFFICFKDCGFLNNQYTVWGQVTSGMEFVDKLAKGEPPAEPDSIIKATIGDASADSKKPAETANDDNHEEEHKDEHKEKAAH